MSGVQRQQCCDPQLYAVVKSRWTHESSVPITRYDDSLWWEILQLAKSPIRLLQIIMAENKKDVYRRVLSVQNQTGFQLIRSSSPLELFCRSYSFIITPTVNGDCALVFQSGSSYHIPGEVGTKKGHLIGPEWNPLQQPDWPLAPKHSTLLSERIRCHILDSV